MEVSHSLHSDDVVSAPPRRETLTDEALYERLQAGDDLCLRVLMDRHGPTAHAICRNILGDVEEAQDVVQDVFFSIWRRGGWRCAEARFSSWLYRVLVNRAIDHRRRRRDIPTDEICLAQAVESARDPGAAEAEDRLAQTDASRKLRAAIARLPAAQAEAMTLHYFNDADVSELTRRLSATESAVRSLLKRGRMALREDLRKQKKIWTDDLDRMARHA